MGAEEGAIFKMREGLDGLSHSNILEATSSLLSIKTEYITIFGKVDFTYSSCLS